jgi:hypothetical protein
VLAAATTAAATIAALRARDARALVLAITVAALVAPLAVEPTPGLLPLAFRVVAALLGGYVLWVSVRPFPARLQPLAMGGTGEAAFIVLAFAIALLVPIPVPGAASAAALAAGLAVGVAAVDLLAFGPDAFRLGTGAQLALLASSLGAAWLGGGLSDASHVGLAIALLAAAVASAWVWLNAAAGSGDIGAGARPRTTPAG